MLRRVTVLVRVTVFELISTEATMAGSALRQRVDERLDMPTGLPDLPGEDHRRIEADDVVAALDH
jgi:hypothetical protein